MNLETPILFNIVIITISFLIIKAFIKGIFVLITVSNTYQANFLINQFLILLPRTTTFLICLILL